MSLVCLCVCLRGCGFPRVSGDEPVLRIEYIIDEAFSPRERG